MALQENSGKNLNFLRLNESKCRQIFDESLWFCHDKLFLCLFTTVISFHDATGKQIRAAVLSQSLLFER